MYFIESPRLKLIPLEYELLKLSINNMPALEQSLALSPAVMHLDKAFAAEVVEAIRYYCLPNIKLYPDLYQWYTNWQVVLKVSNTIIGGISFGGYPDDYGETMVGYVISEQHRSNGYASEALNTLLQWGFSFSVLKAVKADTSINNWASRKVLTKAGFRQSHTAGKLLHYKLSKY